MKKLGIILAILLVVLGGSSLGLFSTYKIVNKPLDEENFDFNKPLAISNAVLKKSYTVDKRFISLDIDVSQWVGGPWWNKSGDIEYMMGEANTEPYDFKNEKLIELTKKLSPAYLRMGGCLADFVSYYPDQREFTHKDPRLNLEVTQERWSSLLQFTKDTQTELYLTINSGPHSRVEGEANLAPLKKMLEDAIKEKAPPKVIEYGNEINKHGTFFGAFHQLTPTKHAEFANDFFRMIRSLNMDITLTGPASVFWPVMGEIGEPLFSVVRAFDNVAKSQVTSFHYYPFQSSRCFMGTRYATEKSVLNPKAFDEFKKVIHSLKAKTDKDIWLGETGHAQCGGQPQLSRSWASGLWWLDHLGTAAQNGIKVVVRQTLTGSDYSLIDEETMTPNIDYYLSMLWKENMGTQVLATPPTGNPFIRHYAHCHPGKNKVTHLLLNISQKKALNVVNNLQILKGFHLRSKPFSTEWSGADEITDIHYLKPLSAYLLISYDHLGLCQ